MSAMTDAMTMPRTDGARAPSLAVLEGLRAQLDTWGFVHLPGLFADVADALSRDFDQHVRGGDLHRLSCPQFMAATPAGERAGVRTAVPDPLSPRSSLGWLGASPLFRALVRACVGDAPYLFGALANLYSCDVHWHHDGIFRFGTARHVTVMMYLDELHADNGALRVIPGSHRPGPFRDELVAEVMSATDEPRSEVFGMRARDVPCTVLPSTPGDVIVIDIDLVHGSFGGGIGRRLLTAFYSEGRGGAESEIRDAIGLPDLEGGPTS